MAIITSFPSCGFLSLLFLNQILLISALDLLEKNRQAKIYFAEKEFENYTDVDELRKAAVNQTVEAWIWAENEQIRADNELARGNRLERNLTETNQEIGKLRSDKNSETVKVKIRDVAIGYRSRIEKLENLLFPPWLLSTKLTREQRFFIASTIYTTKYSGVLHDRLVNETLSPSDYAMALQEIYGDLSNRFEHFQKTHRVPETDEEWKALFEYLELVDEYQKKAMKVSLPGLPVPPKKLSIGENRYFVLVDNVDFKVTKQDVEMLFSSAVDPQGKTNICMIKKFKGLPSGFVAVDFVTKLSKTIEELEDNLESYKQPPFDKKKVNARVYIEP